MQLIEVEFGNGLQLLRQPRLIEAGRQSLPRRRPGLSSQARYSPCKSIRAATAAVQRLGRDGMRRAGGVWLSRRRRARCRAWRSAGVIGTAPIRALGMFSPPTGIVTVTFANWLSRSVRHGHQEPVSLFDQSTVSPSRPRPAPGQALRSGGRRAAAVKTGPTNGRATAAGAREAVLTAVSTWAFSPRA